LAVRAWRINLATGRSDRDQVTQCRLGRGREIDRGLWADSQHTIVASLMNALFQLGYDSARNGEPWRHIAE
jgi:hypothetical protein